MDKDQIITNKLILQSENVLFILSRKVSLLILNSKDALVEDKG